MNAQKYTVIPLPVLYTIITFSHNKDICTFRITCKKIRDEIDTVIQPIVITPILKGCLANHGIIDSNANALYVTSDREHVIKRIDLCSYEIKIIAGVLNRKGWKDGDVNEALFYHPGDIALDSENKMLYINDYVNGAIRKIDLVHNQVSTLYGELSLESDIRGFAIDLTAQCLYICHAAEIKKFSLNKKRVKTLCGGEHGFKNGTLKEAKFDGLFGIALNPFTRKLYVSGWNGGSRVISLDEKTVEDTLLASEHEYHASSGTLNLTLSLQFDCLYLTSSKFIQKISLSERKFIGTQWVKSGYKRASHVVLDDSRCTTYILDDDIFHTKIVNRTNFRKI